MIPSISNFKAEALTDETLRLEAPSIFASGPLSGLSSRYTFVPTIDIISGLRERQWLPVHVEQQRARSSVRFGFQKHLIRFRRAEQMQTLDEWNAELVLTNSHDAGCAYILQVGVYRRLCSNGLVTAGEGFESIRFRHAGLHATEVVAASYRILDSIPKVATFIERFRNRNLNDSESLRFAERALQIRYEEPEEAPVNAATLLTVRRPEDQHRDLWTVFNRVGENLIRGGLSDGRHDKNGRLRTVRALRGLDSKITLNQALWELAHETLSGLN